jgi:hypothetical protein
MPAPTRKRRKAEIVPADAYPSVCSKAQAPVLLRRLKSKEAIAKAAEIIKSKTASLHAAVLGYVDALERAYERGDAAEAYEMAHEIRGLAATAGLPASGSIADGLCFYLDAVRREGSFPEPTILTLHIGAIGRAARADDEATRFGSAVATELRALVDRRLAETGSGARQRSG